MTVHNILPGVLPMQDICIILQHSQCYTVVLEIKHSVFMGFDHSQPIVNDDSFTKC